MITPGMVVCDLDGTLLDTIGDIAAAVNHVRGRLDLPPLSNDTVRSHVGDGAWKLLERCLGCTRGDMPAILKEYSKFYSENLVGNTILYPGVENGLAALAAAGWALAVVSNKSHTHTLEILRHFRMDNFFTMVVGDGLGTPLKPHPEPLLRCLASVGAVPKSSWIVGDNHTDLEAGRRAGMLRCFATYGFGHVGAEDFNVSIDSFDEFPSKAMCQAFLTSHPSQLEMQNE